MSSLTPAFSYVNRIWKHPDKSVPVCVHLWAIFSLPVHSRLFREFEIFTRLPMRGFLIADARVLSCINGRLKSKK